MGNKIFRVHFKDGDPVEPVLTDKFEKYLGAGVLTDLKITDQHIDCDNSSVLLSLKSKHFTECGNDKDIQEISALGLYEIVRGVKDENE